MDIGGYFTELRFNDKHHLGVGDIRLTIGQQEEIQKAYEVLEGLLTQVLKIRTDKKLTQDIRLALDLEIE